MTGPLTALDHVCVAVVGGANTDIVGAPVNALVMHDSNPGSVSVSPGGVGRNVAENLSRMGVETHLVTAFGGDGAAKRLETSCVDAGIRIERSLRVRALPGARYLAINDERRDLSVAVSDMRVIDRILPSELEVPERRATLERADMVVADANLPTESLQWLVDHLDVPIALDPVSTAKAMRVRSLIGRLAAIFPNSYEAGALLGRAVEGEASCRDAAEALVALGCGRVFVSAGPLGVAWADASGSGFTPAPRVDIVSTNGAGDAFSAGAVCGMLCKMPTEECAQLGSALASLTLGGDETVSPHLTPTAIVSMLEELQP